MANINPQNKINQKRAAIEKKNGSLEFNRRERRWIITIDDQEATLSSKKFSALTPKTILKYFEKNKI